MNNLERFRKQYPLELDEAVLITSDINRSYLTGFRSSAGLLVIFKNSAYFFLDFRYMEMAQIARNKCMIPTEISIIPIKNGPYQNVGVLFQEKGIRRYQFEDYSVSYKKALDMKSMFPTLEQNCLGNAVENLRKVKSQKELNKIIQAQKITDEAFSYILGIISPRMTERELALELDFHVLKLGAEAMAFETIVVSGQNSALPHGRPQDNPLTPNGFITIDFGAQLDGYCSDMTRTVSLGKADEPMKKVYSTVLDAQNAAFSVIKGGVAGNVVDDAARRVINKAGYEGCFGHSLGHSLGMLVHESPNFAPTYNTPINTGAVMSVEPGIYLNQTYGVRIEDIVYVTADGFINLTQSPKNLLEL